MNPALRVSVILVSYRTGTALRSTLAAALKQPEIIELILVDNGNPPETARWLDDLARTDRRVHILRGQGNIGFARACNLAARQTRSDLLIFLNPDAQLPPEGLAGLLHETVSLTRPWLLGPRLLNVDGTEQAGARRNGLTPWRALVEATGLFRLALGQWKFTRLNRHTEPVPVAKQQVEAISGACFLVHREDYWAIGGMDEGYFLHVEDLDFCHRFLRTGGTIWFTPAVEVVHLKSTSAAPRPWVEWWKTRGMLRFFYRHSTGEERLLFPLVAALTLLYFTVNEARTLLHRLIK